MKKYLVVSLLVLTACGGTSDDGGKEGIDPVLAAPECVEHADCAGSVVGPACDPDTFTCVTPPAPLLGWGDLDVVSFTEIYRPDSPIETPDLAFHHDRDELWLVTRKFAVPGRCVSTSSFSETCRSMAGSTTLLFSPGTSEQTVETLQDGNARHFMRRPPALAMADNNQFATCGEWGTGNFDDENEMFIGPTLWSADLAIYAQPSGLNGSHLDMLHATPFCMGIAHEVDNVYWTFNGHIGSLDKYDFNEDHGPGADDHSDGEIYRYVEGELSRVPGVPSHMEIHDRWLYVADTGNSRIVALDIDSGERGDRFTPVYEPLADYGYMDDAVLIEVVAPGTLVQPSGLTVHDGVIYVTDHATGMFHAFDLEGNELHVLDADMPDGALAGLTVGPDERIWFTEMNTGAVYRIDVAP